MQRFIYMIIGLWAVSNTAIAQTTIYSQSSGAWNAANLWNTASDGSGASVTDPNSSAYDIVVQAPHAVVLSGTRAAGNLEVQSGASVSAGGTILEYLELYGSSVIINGAAGGGTDGLSFDINGPNCTLSGSGTIQIARLRKDNDPGSASTTILSIDTDLQLHYNTDSRTAFCNTAIGKNFDATLESGRTITVPSGNVSIDGNDGSNSVNHGGTFTIYGSLELLGTNGHLYVETDNSAGFPVQFTIGSGGQVLVGGNLYGNAPGGPALAGLTLESGGSLKISGAVSGWHATKNEVSIASGSLVEYNGYAAQAIEHLWPYADLMVTNSDKSLTGNTTVSETLTLNGSDITLGEYNLRMEPYGNISGAGPGAYLRTNGYGKLQQTTENTPLWYPVGNSSYNPVRLRNSGASDVIGVRVADEVLDEGPGGDPLTTQAVDCSWFLEEDYPGGSDLEAMVQWNGLKELSGFNRSNCKLAFWNNNAWNTGSTGPAQGTNPYTRLRNAMTDPEVLAVVSGATLPVEWAAFDAEYEGGMVHLRWETAAESQNAGFQVERSTDALRYVSIAWQAAKANAASYLFTDVAPPQGTVYYRLRQVDVDGQFSFSPVRAVEASGALNTMRLFPVPARAFVAVDLPNGVEEVAHWQVLDAAGATRLSGLVLEGEMPFRVGLESLGPGVYTLMVRTGPTTQARLLLVE